MKTRRRSAKASRVVWLVLVLLIGALLASCSARAPNGEPDVPYLDTTELENVPPHPSSEADAESGELEVERSAVKPERLTAAPQQVGSAPFAPEEDSTAGDAIPETRDAELEATVEAHLAGMTLEQKVGQLFMVGFQGTEPGPDTRGLIQDHHLGGLILFRRNIAEADQVARLNHGLQEAARASSTGVPLFISIDQEGGVVARIVRGVTVFPGNMALGATGDAELALLAAETTSRELAALGVNMNFGPVVDVNNNPRNPVIGTRAFGSSPEMVARLGEAAIAGTRAAGVAAVAKHFPGHGDTHVDSHYALPVLEHTAGRLSEVELVPFRTAIAAGVDAIMTAHVHLPAVEPGDHVPATLSHTILTGLLREELGYDGLVVTDAMEMAAIRGSGSMGEAVVRAFEAGADVLLIARAQADDLRSLDAMAEAVRSGRVSEERLDASVRRVLRTKAAMGLFDPQPDPLAAGEDRGEAAAVVARTVAQRAITVVRDEAGLLPAHGALEGGILAISTRAPTASLVEDRDSDARLAAALERHVQGVDEILLPARPSSREIEAAARAAAGKRLVVLGTYDAWRSDQQQALVREVLASGTPTVVVGLRTPYDLLALPEIPTYVAAYSDRAVALEALVEVLLGRFPAQGRLPVELPGLYPLGHGQVGP